MVGSAIASRLVKMGSREAGNEKARNWAQAAGANASDGSFADAATFGVLVFNCTAGEHSIAALEQAGSANLPEEKARQVPRSMTPSASSKASTVGFPSRPYAMSPSVRYVEPHDRSVQQRTLLSLWATDRSHKRCCG